MTLTGECLMANLAPSAEPLILLAFPTFEGARCIPASVFDGGQSTAKMPPSGRHNSAAGRSIKLA
jgi:hypothetical protein